MTISMNNLVCGFSISSSLLVLCHLPNLFSIPVKLKKKNPIHLISSDGIFCWSKIFAENSVVKKMFIKISEQVFFLVMRASIIFCRQEIKTIYYKIRKFIELPSLPLLSMFFIFSIR